MSNIIYLLLLIFNVKASNYYKNYRLYKVFPDNAAQVNLLRSFETLYGVEFWEAHIAVNYTQKVMVAPSHAQRFKAALRKDRVKYKLLFKDVQKLINNQKKRSSDNQFNWRAYMTLERINAWLDELLDFYPEVVSIVTIGRSTELRELKGIIINYNKERENNTEVGIIEGSIHAREWMSTAMVTWLIHEFLTSNEPEIRWLAEVVEWHILPVINPDGYAYTFEKRRFWKKNRNKKYFQSCKEYGVDDDISNGVDLNRNFDLAWLATSSASANPCSNNFGGSAPFSEMETLFLSEYVEWKTKDTNLLYYISFHQYSQMILIPYGHVMDGETLESPNFNVVYKAAKKGAETIKNKYGIEYKVGLAPDILYPTSSSSIDYVKLIAEVPSVYQIGLSDYKDHGYLAPPEQIVPTCQQAMELLVEINKNIESTNYENSHSRTPKKISYLKSAIKSIYL